MFGLFWRRNRVAIDSIGRLFTQTAKIGGVYSAGGQLIVQQKSSSSVRKKRNGLFKDPRYVVSKGQPVRGPAQRRQAEIRAKNRPTIDWTLEESTEDNEDLVKITANEQVVGNICRSALNGPVVHWKARRKAQLIPRAKLRPPLANYQRSHSTFSSDKTEDDHESKKRKSECRKKIISPILQMEPQMIRVKESLSPTSHLHSEKIRISNDAAIFEIKREIPLEGAKFSSRYEIYNSTTRPFGKSYRELTFSSSGSGISSCESQSSVSSSGLSETTTYITCSSEIEPVQMTGFHCIDELSEKHHVSIYNEHSYDDLHEATNYNLEPLDICDFVTTESEDNSSEGDIVANQKPFAETFSNSSNSTERTSQVEVIPRKPLVPVETWSNSGGSSNSVAEPLKSPQLLRQVISNYEGHLLYAVPKSSTKTTYEEEEYTYEPKLNTSSSKTVTKCRSMLNLEVQPDSSFSPSLSTPPPPKPLLAKATSESNLQRDQEKKRIIKTISMMLENRRKRPSSPPAQQSPLLDDLPAIKPNRVTSTVAEAINASLAHDKAELLEDRRSRTIDRSCRVTGEILKDKSIVASATSLSPPDYHRNVYTLPRSTKSHRSQLQRHFYYPHHVGGKSSTRVPDEELPDPDKVRNARQLFERVLKISSLENMLSGNRPGKVQTLPPISPVQVTQPLPQYPRPTPEIRQPVQHIQQHPKLQKSLSVDTSHPVTISHCRWMDNGSVSSGVGSDISVETDLELSPKSTPCSRGGSECDSKDDDAMFTSDEDLTGSREAVEDLGKPISADVLSNIRAYGTSVTYYGGKIIASSKGYTCSPMTMTIMNEIKQSSPDYHANRKFLFDDKQLSKFRLIKSNSCGSRLELSGTEEYGKEYEKRLNGTHHNFAQANHNQQEDYNNNEGHRETATIKEEDEEEQQPKKCDKATEKCTIIETKAQSEIENGNPKQNGWCNKKGDKMQLKENGKTHCDMEFEEFEVLEESK